MEADAEGWRVPGRCSLPGLSVHLAQHPAQHGPVVTGGRETVEGRECMWANHRAGEARPGQEGKRASAEGSGYRPIGEHQQLARRPASFSPCPPATEHPSQFHEFIPWGRRKALRGSNSLGERFLQQWTQQLSEEASGVLVLLGSTCHCGESR